MVTAGLAVDPGSAVVTVALDSGQVLTSPADGDRRDRLVAALAAAGQPRPASACVTAPEAWLDGSAAGTAALEALRQACEDAGIGRVGWAGQLASVAALAAGRHGSGRYLVADVGAAGVRAATLEVEGQAIRVMAAAQDAGGGARDFDARLRAGLPPGPPLAPDWHREAAGQDRRAGLVLRQAAADADYRQARAYLAGGRDLSAGPVIDAFAPTAARLAACVAAVAGRVTAEVVLLTGGLGWLPLALAALGEAAGAPALTASPDSAARGALLFASGAARLDLPALPPVTLPMNRIRHGRLEEVTLVLPWTEPFASPPGGQLAIDGPELVLDIAGRRASLHLAGLVPGPQRIGLRAGWNGSAALVIRPAGTGVPVITPLDLGVAP